MADQSIDEIVTQAVKDAPAQLEETSLLVDDEGKQIPAKEATASDKEKTKEDPKEDAKDEKDEYGLTVQDQLEARQLLAALRDPDKAPAVIDFLARAQGYKRGDELTKKEEKTVVKGMVEELKEALGPELEYLADKMGPVFEKFLKQHVEEAQKPIKETIDQQILEREQKAAGTSIEELGTTYFDGDIPTDLMDEMSKVMDRIKPSEGQKMKDYMEEILFVAAGKKGVVLQKTSKSKAEKILKNRNDAPTRMASEGSRSPKVGEVALNPRKQMTLDDAVRQATEQAKASVQ